VVNYLRACPLPEAEVALKKLEEIDPESVRRANTFFSIPVPAKDTGSSSSAIMPQSDQQLAAIPSGAVKPGQRTAAISTRGASTVALSTSTPNSWRLAYVLSLAIATLMIALFLLLSGGTQPTDQ
jgi:hypothetical protein